MVARRMNQELTACISTAFHNSIPVAVKKGPFTPEEDELITQLHAEYGSKWAEIAKHLPGRP